MTATPEPTERANLPRLLNISEIAEMLAVEVRHVRRLVHERRIPYIKWGHLLRFDPKEISDWLAAHRKADIPDGRRRLGPSSAMGSSGDARGGQ